MPDHFGNQLSPIPAIMSAANATSTLRVGTYVLSNDFRHPAQLAKEVATIDLLSGGRCEPGIGAGWDVNDYTQIGMTLDPPGVRLARLEEAVQIMKALFREEPVSYSGKYYSIDNLRGTPRPVQQPGPPIMIGGGGKRLLSLAAREADIIGLGPKIGADGVPSVASISAPATAEKVGWVREAAGERWRDLEINIFVYTVTLTDTPVTGRERVIEELLAENPEYTAELLSTNPHTLIGTLDEVVEQLQSRRKEYGISYITVPEYNMENLAPVVAVLAGK